MAVYQDPSGRAAGPRALRVRGLIVALVLALVGTVLFQLSRGKYDDTFELTVVANSVGEGLTPGAEVKFHGLTIGSVKTLEATGYNRQRMTVLLDARQARALTADTSARFTSSNVFGSPAVELVSGGTGGPLAANRTLEIGSDVQAASITGVLRQGQKLTSVIDSPEVELIIDVLRRHGRLIGPTAKSAFDLAKILADSQTTPFSESLSVIASFLNGITEFVPVFDPLKKLLDGLDFVVQPGGADRTNKVLLGLGRVLQDASVLFNQNNSWLVPLTQGLFNAVVPASYAMGSLAPAYDRLPGLIDRTSAAFPVVDGKVRMQIQVILDTMPGLAAALPPGDGGGR